MTRTNQILLAVVAAVAASAAFYMLLLSPKREEASRLATEVNTAQATLEQARRDLADYQTAKASYQQSYASVVRLGKAVPADDDVRSLMVQLDSAATKSRVDFRTIQVGGGSAPAAGTPGAMAGLPPGATVGVAGFPTMPFSFTFTGSFFRLSEFFSRLERFVNVRNKGIAVSGRLLTLDSLTLEPDQSGFPNIKAQVGATSYLVSPSEGITGGASPTGPNSVAGAAQAIEGRDAAAGATAASTTATSTGAIR